MKIITKKLTKEILLAATFVSIALVSLFAFFELIKQLDEINETFSMADAVVMTLLILPTRMYEIMPIACLLGAVFIMSRWASSSEFTALRCAGMSPVSFAMSLLVPGIILVGMTYLVGEVIAPAAQRYSQELRVDGDAITARGFLSGAWVRDVVYNEKNEKIDRYINVHSLNTSDRSTTGAWRLFEFKPNGQLDKLVESDRAHFVPGQGWILETAKVTVFPRIDVKNTEPNANKIHVTHHVRYFFQSHIDPDILYVLTMKPEKMSMRDLDRYVDHLRRNEQNSEPYEIAFWGKFFYPLAVLVMLAVSMPFAYMNTRSGGMAIKIFGGVMIGIVFYALNHVFSYLGIVNTWSPLAVSVTPTIVMLGLATVAMYWVERR